MLGCLHLLRMQDIRLIMWCCVEAAAAPSGGGAAARQARREERARDEAIRETKEAAAADNPISPPTYGRQGLIPSQVAIILPRNTASWCLLLCCQLETC